MTQQPINILIIEDHYMIIDGFKSMLSMVSGTRIGRISAVNNCEQAYTLLATVRKNKFDVVFLDWNLPVFAAKNLYDGGDLVPLIKIHSPNAKLIILTSHIEAITLYNIMHKVRPDALLCKVDFMREDFPDIYRRIWQGELFLSRTAAEQVKQITSRALYLDNYNREIISLLAKGVKTKNLPQYLPLSISAINKRKAQIKDYFILGKGDDEDIVEAAKRNGLI